MNERRKFKRFQCAPQNCEISFDLAKHPGAIVEESVGGMKLRGLDLLVVPEDCPVQIEQLGVTQAGTVRSVSRVDGKFQLGVSLQRKKPEASEFKKLLLGCFVYEDNHLLPCQPVGMEAGDRVRIEFPPCLERIGKLSLPSEDV